MTEETTETPDVEETPEETVEATGTPEDVTDPASTQEGEPDAEPDAFPRSYVEELRKENRRYREHARDRDELAHRLHVALVAATGRLADPTDLEFADDHLADAETLTGAIDALIERKPHLASRRPRGAVQQGASAPRVSTDLFGLLRDAAR